jgi:uncharacterized protein YbaP (TraB family)
MFDHFLAGKKTVFIIAFLIVVASSGAPVQAGNEVRPGSAKGDRHFLWSAETGENTVYLLGSIHLLRRESYPLPDAIEKIYDCCNIVVFETDIDRQNDPKMQNRMRQRGLYPRGQTLSGNISGETYRLLGEKLSAAGLKASSFEQFKPWFAAIAVSGMELQRLGFDPALGIDRHFFERAKKDRKKLVFLETNEYQINLFAGLNRSKQEILLRQMLKEIDVIERMFSSIVDSWQSGNAQKLGSILDISFRDYPEIYNQFIIKRNKIWVRKIEKLMNQRDNVLVIVGAGHLTGRESIIELLLRKGYKVTQK